MTPIFYSFRRCPYAMRARLALQVSGQRVELREVLLRNKAPEFLEASPSATVPCLVDGTEILDESLDIMCWALARNDPNAWLDMPADGHELIARFDGPFKNALDRTKYHTRYGSNPDVERDNAQLYLFQLNDLIGGKAFLYKESPSLADMAILPFVRQFAFIDKALFDAQDWPNLSRWLERFLVSDLFVAIMPKYPVWQAGDQATLFP